MSEFDPGRFDFEENPVVTRILNNEVDRRTAEIEARHAIEVANEKVKIYFFVMMFSLAVSGALAVSMLQINHQSQPVIKIQQPN